MTHEFSDASANAAECAHDQGKFDEFATALFNDQARIGKRSWTSFGTEAGIADTTLFVTCIDRHTFAQVIERDEVAADSVNLFGTPTLIINGKVLTGAQSVRTLNREIDDALSRVRR